VVDAVTQHLHRDVVGELGTLALGPICLLLHVAGKNLPVSLELCSLHRLGARQYL